MFEEKNKLTLLGVASLFILLVSLLMIIPTSQAGEALKPFKSDGCSLFPEGTVTQETLWLLCCVSHDYHYWQGGTYQQRLDADKALQQCVTDVGEEEVAALMLAGVRVGGTPLLPTTFRWGYGWPYPKWYGELSDEQQSQVNKQAETSALIKNCVDEKDHSLCRCAFMQKH